MNHARHTFYISSVYKANSLAYSTACSPPHRQAGALALPYDPSLRLERPISRGDTLRVAFPFRKKVELLTKRFIKNESSTIRALPLLFE